METKASSRTMPARLASVGHAYLDMARSPRYFPLWLGQFASNFGDTLYYVGPVVLVNQLPGRGADLVDVVDIRPAYWLGGTLLAAGGILGLALVGTTQPKLAGDHGPTLR